MTPRGLCTLVLHAHLPFIRHPEHRYHLEENWLYEATIATYLPIYEVLEHLVKDGVRARLAMSFSPALLEMLADPLLQERTADTLERMVRLGDQELQRNAAGRWQLARFYRDRFARLSNLYQRLDRNLIQAYARLADTGMLELMTVGATHAYQPMIREPNARRAQLHTAARAHQRHFGRPAHGIWLPECGYTEGIDELVAEAGLTYFFVDAHAIEGGSPRPRMGTHAPVLLPSGTCAIGRDIDSSRQVWSSKEGYPGDPWYRDFYRDIGFDLPLSVIGEFVHPDGIRVHTGYKYHRVTGEVDLAHKETYVPERALERTDVHAADFVARREAKVAQLAEAHGQVPLIACPYDAELFGHWWFEGPEFIDRLCRRFAESTTVAMATPSEALAALEPSRMETLSPSSWGEGGYSSVWLDGANDWIYPHQHACETRMVELARKFEAPTPLERRALTQAARELMLLSSSDWAFILKTGTATGYAVSRVKAHAARFMRLAEDLETRNIDDAWLSDLEQRDNLFQDLDYRVFA